MLVAICSKTGERIDALSASPSGAYQCPNCGSRVRLKNGAIRISHFAHQVDRSCPYASGETIGHQKAKVMLWKSFQARGIHAEPEVFVKTLTGDRRADVMVWSPAGRPVAIEVQHSSISLDDIHDRTNAYLQTNIPVLWTVLAKDWFDEDEQPAAKKIGQYAAPLWQRWIHGYNYGHLWFIDPIHNALIRGTFSNAGYKRYKRLEMSDPVSLSALRIEKFQRQATSLGRYKFPGGGAARFTMAEDCSYRRRQANSLVTNCIACG